MKNKYIYSLGLQCQINQNGECFQTFDDEPATRSVGGSVCRNAIFIPNIAAATGHARSIIAHWNRALCKDGRPTRPIDARNERSVRVIIWISNRHSMTSNGPEQLVNDRLEFRVLSADEFAHQWSNSGSSSLCGPRRVLVFSSAHST
jgi:hypothetical protein